MFFRTKKSGTRSYLQVVENRWENGRSRQRVVATLGRLDQLQAKRPTRCSPRLGCSIGPVRRSCFPLTPRGDSLSSKPRTSGRLSSLIGSGNRPAANASSRNYCHVAASSSTSSGPSFSPCSIVSSSPAVIELPTSGRRIIRSRAATPFNCTTSTGPWLGSAKSCPRASRRTTGPVARPVGVVPGGRASPRPHSDGRSSRQSTDCIGCGWPVFGSAPPRRRPGGPEPVGLDTRGVTDSERSVVGGSGHRGGRSPGDEVFGHAWGGSNGWEERSVPAYQPPRISCITFFETH